MNTTKCIKHPLPQRGGGGLSYVKGSYVSPYSISIPAFYEIKVETL